MQQTWTISKNPQEPDFVAGLLLDAIPEIYHRLSNILLQYKLELSIAAVYCHQTPKVSFHGMRKSSCELGDILFIHQHRPIIGTLRRNALLFQAKVSPNHPTNINPSNDQLRLYLEWPEFKYVNSGLLNGLIRFVTPNTPHLGAQYMLIDKRPPSHPHSGLQGIPGTFPIGCCIADPYLFIRNDLASELFDFLILCTGRAFSARTPAPTDGWSQMVWDLLETSVKNFTRTNTYGVNRRRLTGVPLSSLDGIGFAQRTSGASISLVEDLLGVDRAEQLFAEASGEPPTSDQPQEIASKSGGGISVVIIETTEGE